MKQPGFIRLATLALLSTLSFFSHGETILRLAYAENSQPVKDALHFLGQQVEEKTGGDIKVQYFPDGQRRRARTGGVDAGRRRRHH